MDDSQSHSAEYEIDRGIIQLAWLRFLHLHPGAAAIGPMHQCAHFNGWLRAEGQKLVRPTTFYLMLGHLARHTPKGTP